MKILLMLPIMNLKKLWGKLHRGAGNNNFHTGLASIAAYLIKYGYDVNILDPQFFSDENELVSFLQKGAYDLIGITTYTPTYIEAKETVKICRISLPASAIVMGGPHCTYFPVETLSEIPELDYVISGEGEETLLELLKFLNNEIKNISTINGLTYKKEGKILQNEKREFLDINSLPIPAYHLFPLKKYNLQPTVYKKLPTYTILSSRGCPYQCSFCHGFEILGKKMRYRNEDLLLDELEYLIKDFNAKGFMFYDSTFTLNKSWVASFCEKIIKRKLKFYWMCLTRSDCINLELLKLMNKSGCWSISFGIESANQKSLDLLKKNTTVEQNINAIKWAKKVGMFVTATYMLALPNENEKDTFNTIKFAKENPTHVAHFFWPIPYPKTLFYEQCKNVGGITQNPKWEDFNFYSENPVYVNPNLGIKKMKEIQRYAIKSYYSNPKVWLLNLSTINSLTDINKYLKAAFAITGMIK